MLVSLPRNTSLSCYQSSSEAHAVHLQSYKPKYVPICKHFITTDNSPKPGGFASGGCCADSALNLQGLPSPPDNTRWQAMPPRLPSCIFHSQIRGGACQETPRDNLAMLRLQKARGWQPVPRHRRAAPSPSGDSQAPRKESLQSVEVPFPPQGGSETISLCGFLSPHQSHSCCTSAWGLDGSHSAMLLPPKYLLALLHCFAVVFPSAPNYTKTIY